MLYPLRLEVMDLLPDIITHLGPKQFKHLTGMFKKPDAAGAEGIKESTAEEEEDVPNLVR